MSILPSVPTVWQCLKVRLQTWICLQPSSERLVITPQRIEMMVVMSTKECLTRSNMIITRSTWASTSHRVTVGSVVTRAPMTTRGSPTTNRARWKYTLYIWGSVASNSMLTHHSFPPEPYTHHHHHHHHQHHHHHLTFWAVPPSKPGVTLARIRGHTLPLLASGPGENKSYHVIYVFERLFESTISFICTYRCKTTGLSL